MSTGMWILAFPIASMLCAGVTVWLARDNRRLRMCVFVHSAALRECMTIVDALAQRGAVRCDVCHGPIAPRTPTVVEGTEGAWSLAHAGCVDAT